MRLAFFFLVFFTPLVLAQTNRLALTDPHKPLLVSSSARQVIINLSSNPTTGYSWRLKFYDPTIITPIKQTYKPPQPAIPGAQGIESFIFEVNENAFKVKRATEVTFIYLRPWNMDITQILTFNIISE